MKFSLNSTVFVFGFALIPLAGEEPGFSTVVEERSYADPPTGDLVSNGVITPLDQEMKNFYISNADGAIEVQLTDDAEIGLQTRIQKGGFESRKLEFTIGEKSLALRCFVWNAIL